MVAIIIVNWNSWNYLANCLKALSKQTYKNFKVFVIDNASLQSAPDNIFDIIPDATFIFNEENVGFAKANNQAADIAKTADFIFLLNPDAYPNPDCLEKLIASANKFIDFSAFGSRLVDATNPSVFDGDGDRYHISGFAWRDSQGSPVKYSNQPRAVFSVCAASALVRKEVFHQCGGFDTDFFCYYEDIDLFFRMRLLGHKCLQIPDAITYHVGSSCSEDVKSDFVLYMCHRNSIWAYIKNMPFSLLLLSFPLFLSINISSLFLYLIYGKLNVVLKGQTDAFLHLKKTFKKRKRIQVGRKIPIHLLLSNMDKKLLPDPLFQRIKLIFFKKS